MSEATRRLAKAKDDLDAVADEKRQEQDDAEEPEQEARVRKKIIAETERAGATLGRPDAKGGLPPSLVLGMLRRDKFRCKACGAREDLGPHHIGGICSSERTSRLGHQNKLSNLTTLCEDCHDKAHEDARAQGVDSSQVKPEGDQYFGQHGHAPNDEEG